MNRKQLTLFLAQDESETIEAIRKRYNPEQYQLIKSHITLCREDEIEDINRIQNNLKSLDMRKLVLHTNGLKRFSDGKGVLISVIDAEQQFQKLRARILQHKQLPPRNHEAHITLMHPRNSTCDDLIFKELQQFSIPQKITLPKISLIEQENGKAWRTVEEYELK